MPLFLFGTVLITAFAIVIVVFLIIQKQRQVRGRLERQQLEHNYSQSLLSTKIEVQEQALKTVSQEIHDNVGQVLSSSSMQLTALRSYLPEDSGKELLEDTIGLVRKAIKDLRALSHSLNNGLIEHREIEDAIQGELDRIQAFSGIKCNLNSHANFQLDPGKRLLIFRIVQEALQNTIKHAGATEIDISVTTTDHQLKVEITDNGKGFDTSNSTVASSLGMTNMRERSELLNGNINVTSSIGKGTTIALVVPVNS